MLELQRVNSLVDTDGDETYEPAMADVLVLTKPGVPASRRVCIHDLPRQRLLSLRAELAAERDRPQHWPPALVADSTLGRATHAALWRAFGQQRDHELRYLYLADAWGTRTTPGADGAIGALIDSFRAAVPCCDNSGCARANGEALAALLVLAHDSLAMRAMLLLLPLRASPGTDASSGCAAASFLEFVAAAARVRLDRRSVDAVLAATGYPPGARLCDAEEAAWLAGLAGSERVPLAPPELLGIVAGWERGIACGRLLLYTARGPPLRAALAGLEARGVVTCAFVADVAAFALAPERQAVEPLCALLAAFLFEPADGAGDASPPALRPAAVAALSTGALQSLPLALLGALRGGVHCGEALRPLVELLLAFEPGAEGPAPLSARDDDVSGYDMPPPQPLRLADCRAFPLSQWLARQAAAKQPAADVPEVLRAARFAEHLAGRHAALIGGTAKGKAKTADAAKSAVAAPWCVRSAEELPALLLAFAKVALQCDPALVAALYEAQPGAAARNAPPPLPAAQLEPLQPLIAAQLRSCPPACAEAFAREAATHAAHFSAAALAACALPATLARPGAAADALAIERLVVAGIRLRQRAPPLDAAVRSAWAAACSCEALKAHTLRLVDSALRRLDAPGGETRFFGQAVPPAERLTLGDLAACAASLHAAAADMGLQGAKRDALIAEFEAVMDAAPPRLWRTLFRGASAAAFLRRVSGDDASAGGDYLGGLGTEPVPLFGAPAAGGRGEGAALAADAELAKVIKARQGKKGGFALRMHDRVWSRTGARDAVYWPARVLDKFPLSTAAVADGTETDAPRGSYLAAPLRSLQWCWGAPSDASVHRCTLLLRTGRACGLSLGAALLAVHGCQCLKQKVYIAETSSGDAAADLAAWAAFLGGWGIAVERGLVLGKSAEWHKENDAPVTFFSFDALDDFYHEYVGFEGAACTAVLLDELPRHAGDEAAWQRQVAALQADVPPAPPPPPPPKVEPPKPAPAPAPAPPPPPPKPEPEPVVEIKPAAEPEVWSLKAAPAGAGAEGEDDGAAEAE